MLTDREADSVEIHVVDDEFHAELVSEELCDLHVDTDILVAVHVLEGLEAGVGSDNELILGGVELSRGNGVRSAVAEVVVADLVEGAVLHDLLDEGVGLLEKLGLCLVDAESVFLFGEVDVNDLDCLFAAAAGREADGEHRCRHDECDYFFHDVFSPLSDFDCQKGYAYILHQNA